MLIDELCEWFEAVIEDLMEEYRWSNDVTLEWQNGAIEACERLLEMLKE